MPKSKRRTTHVIGEPFWDDRPLFIIGGGTSIRDVDWDEVRRKGRTLGCNRSAFAAKTDAVVTLDNHWLRMDRPRIFEYLSHPDREAFFAIARGQEQKHYFEGACLLRRERKGNIISGDPGELVGTNTGFSSLGVAYHKRAREIYLMGFDMTAGPDGVHFHGGYSWTSKRVSRYMLKWAGNFGHAADTFAKAGVKIYNMVGTPRSKIPSNIIEQVPLEKIYDLADTD